MASEQVTLMTWKMGGTEEPGLTPRHLTRMLCGQTRDFPGRGRSTRGSAVRHRLTSWAGEGGRRGREPGLRTVLAVRRLHPRTSPLTPKGGLTEPTLPGETQAGPDRNLPRRTHTEARSRRLCTCSGPPRGLPAASPTPSSLRGRLARHACCSVGRVAAALHREHRTALRGRARGRRRAARSRSTKESTEGPSHGRAAPRAGPPRPHGRRVRTRPQRRHRCLLRGDNGQGAGRFATDEARP